MATYTNPAGPYQGGTPDADTFRFDVPLASSITIDGLDGFDRLVVDRTSNGEATQFRAADAFDSGTFYISVRNGPYGTSLTAFQFEDLKFTGSGFDDSFELVATPYSSHLLVDYDGGAGSDVLTLDFSKRTTALGFILFNGVITSSFGKFANFETFNIQSGSGNDTIRTGDLADDINAGSGSDDIRTGGGSDKIYVETGGDYIDMGVGDHDFFQGNYGAATDALIANLGDTVSISNGTTILNAESLTLGTGSGNDQFNVTRGGSMTLYGGAGYDTLSYAAPLAGPQSFTVGSNGGILSGAANDGFFSEMERIVLTGGAGDDTFQLSGDFAASSISFDGAGGTDYLWASFEGLAGSSSLIASGNGVIFSNRGTFAGFERFQLTGGNLSDVFTTRSGNDILWGRGGDDQFDSGDGNDSLYGGEGNDNLSGGSGNDVIDGEGGNDALISGAGDDHLYGRDGLDSLYVSGTGTKRAEGGLDRDILTVAYGDAVTSITMSAPLSEPGGGYAGTIGDGGARSLTYSTIDVFSIFTGSGNDIVRDAANSGNFYGLGAGNDLYYHAGGSDLVEAGDGFDGFNGDLSALGIAIEWSLVPIFGSGFQDRYVNFEYFASLTTGGGRDLIHTSTLDLDDIVILGGNDDQVIFYDGHDYASGGGAGATDTGTDMLVLNYIAATTGVHNIGAVTSHATGYSGQYGDDSTRLATFEAIDQLVISTGSGADDITTGGGDDQVRTRGGNDILATGGGDDLLDGGAGDDIMTGGAGDDFYWVSSQADVVNENEGEGQDEIHTELAVYSLLALANVEALSASTNLSLARDFRGNAANNVIKGGDASDLLRLYDGGDDVVFGGAGNDNIFFIGSLTEADIVIAGDGVDTLVLQGPYGALVMSANVMEIENISLLGGGNTNFGDPGANFYDYGLTTNDANFAAGVQARINGAALLAGEDFTFDGSAETDAKFVVYGGRGKDTLTGGLGNDIFFLAEDRFASGDTVNGGSGYDGMFLRGNYTIDFNAPGYTGLFTSIENLTLTSATDERYARGGGSEFDYNITLSNALVGAGAVLTVSGTILTASETMILDGSLESDGALRLFGGKANDTLKGGGQADILHGNLGADILAGGGGADIFRYDSTAESNSASRDQILDFAHGSDKIDLSRIDANSLAAGDQAFAWIGASAFTGSGAASAGQLRAYQDGASWFVEGDTNGDGAADMVIQLNVAGGALIQTDFLP